MRKKLYLICILWVFQFLSSTVRAQKANSPAKPVYVIVHGAWGGSWAFKKADSLLTAKGSTVYRPSLTGLGERVHLAHKDIGLQTHINDVVNTILFEDLKDIILVGHSYGGMVITGVADSVPGRISKLIYLDAFFPSDGESIASIVGETSGRSIISNAKDGFIIPAWVQPDAKLPHDVPHPLKTLTDTIYLKSKTPILSITYILTVDSNRQAKDDDFGSQAERARARGAKIVQFTADHNPQWSAVDELVNLLHQESQNSKVKSQN